ncbi:ACT domain-containing protein [Natroniella sulfidigena]|uniref:ACT domain-containing protein n=1 Tax=Natroniella sulfidigena TaxID=723921 RepID=UPI00200A2347|nr:ACT domain-containing protein [Natroniella sulfidigena]MCK8817743.1 ACT domain-containing protein [Natroniella sulfidigena]
MGKDFYIVAEEILSPAMKKTVKVKELLKNGEEEQIKEAVERVGLSRSAYYKYRDYIFPFVKQERQELATLSLLVADQKGNLSKVLTKIAQYHGNILTINQDIPLNQVAHVTITIESNNLVISVEQLISNLEGIGGIKRVKLITQSFKQG